MRKSEIFKYISFFLVFLFFFYLQDKTGINGFAVPLFVALVYSRQNILFLAPIYLAAAMIVSPTVQQLIIASTPPVLILIAVFVHYKIKKKIKLAVAAAYLLICQLPLVFFMTDSLNGALSLVISIILSELLLYSFVVVSYALLTKKLKFRLTLEEIIAFSAVAAVFGAGMIAVNIEWYTPFYTFLAIISLVFLYIDPKSSIVASTSFALGAAILQKDPSILALGVIYGITAACFSRETEVFAALAVIAVDAIFRTFFMFSPPFLYFSLISPAVGVILFLVFPRKIKRRIKLNQDNGREKFIDKLLVNRDRQRVAERLSALSNIFNEIEEVLLVENAAKRNELDLQELTKEVCGKVCAVCPALMSCKEALGGNTDVIVSTLSEAALAKGKATILDTPSFLSSRCRKINSLISVVNDTHEQRMNSDKRRRELDEGRLMVGEQMGGVSDILKELKKEVEKNLSYDSLKEKVILEELQARNIAATEAALYAPRGENPSLVIMVKESDSQNIRIEETVSRLMGTQMWVVKREKVVVGMESLTLEKKPKFQVVYGERNIIKGGGEVSGDRYRAMKMDGGKVLIILSDGMGSGREAGLSSSYAISLIESFYKAGFSYDVLVKAVSRLMTLSEKEVFSAVDIAVIDTLTGMCDFVKLGGRESFIVKKGAVEVIECGSLPIGIIEEVEPIVERRELFQGSFVILVSDGVIDVLGRDGMTNLLSEVKTNNPDSLCGIVAAEVKRLGGENYDDATIIAARVYLSQKES